MLKQVSTVRKIQLLNILTLTTLHIMMEKLHSGQLKSLSNLVTMENLFFMAIGYVSPHLPFIQPKKYWDMYDHDKIKLAENTYQPLNSPDIAIEAQHNSAELRKNYLGIPAEGLLDEKLSRDLIHGIMRVFPIWMQ